MLRPWENVIMSQYTDTFSSLRKRIEDGDAVTEQEISNLRGLSNMPDVESSITLLLKMLSERDRKRLA